MNHRWKAPSRRVVLTMLLVAAGIGRAAAADSMSPSAAANDPIVILAQAKAATGGAAWDDFRSQHSLVKITTNIREGKAERWASILTGRSRLRLEMGLIDVILGYDGIASWSQEPSGKLEIDRDPNTTELAANGAYRDRLAFWYPERQRAKIDYSRREQIEGTTFDVIRIIPDGGRAFELWVNAATHRIERLREGESNTIRSEVYSDFRNVQGATVPFAVTVWRGERTPEREERYLVQRLEYNVPLDGIEFSPQH